MYLVLFTELCLFSEWFVFLLSRKIALIDVLRTILSNRIREDVSNVACPLSNVHENYKDKLLVWLFVCF